MATKQNLEKDIKILYAIIAVLFVILLIMLVLLFSVRNEKPLIVQGNQKQVTQNINTPIEIKKPDDIKKAEGELIVERSVTLKEDGTIVVKGQIINISKLQKDIVLNDIVENIKFEKKVEFENAEITAKNGNLFPPGGKVTVSAYGKGNGKNKPSNVMIALLDVNFSNKSLDTVLYEFTFKPNVKVEKLIFDPMEARSGKFILNLNGETIEVK